MRTIDNTQDVMDSRDMIEQLEEWESERENLVDLLNEAETEEEKTEAQEALNDWDSDYGDEYKALKAFCEEAEGYASDWKYGEAVINDDYFEEYAKDLAHDCCDMGKAEDWPFRCIDWEAAADELKKDYCGIEYDGVTYWVRSI